MINTGGVTAAITRCFAGTSRRRPRHSGTRSSSVPRSVCGWDTALFLHCRTSPLGRRPCSCSWGFHRPPGAYQTAGAAPASSLHQAATDGCGICFGASCSAAHGLGTSSTGAHISATATCARSTSGARSPGVVATSCSYTTCHSDCDWGHSAGVLPGLDGFAIIALSASGKLSQCSG